MNMTVPNSVQEVLYLLQVAAIQKLPFVLGTPKVARGT